MWNMNKIIISIAALLLAACANAQVVFVEETLHKRAPKVPEYVVFAGDTVRFDKPELYERMDRELLAFTYMHTNSNLMLRRADRIFSQVVPVLRKEGVHEDLKYLMAIESNLDPKIVSSAGAAGLWQFMKATGKSYGLEVSTEVDERYHIAKATKAACDYLKEAYAKYGDWMTVAASYNGGQNGISNRLAAQQENSALDLWLVEETSRYMFRILVAKLFFENPESFGYQLEPSEKYSDYPVLKTVTVSGPIASLVDFAKSHGVSYAQLKQANLWLRSDKLTNKEGRIYRIVIPDVGQG